MDIYQAFRKQDILDQIPSGKIVAAVSGGGDSVAMLHLMHRLARERKWRIFVVHIQHFLRGKDSVRDQKFVEALAKKFSLPFVLRSIDVKGSLKQRKYKRLGLEASARELRYGAFSQIARGIGAHVIFTAHTADDQAETFFLNLLRGSGIDGLCGIHPLRPLIDATGNASDKKIHLFRPCLPFSKAELTRYLSIQGLKHCLDSSNLNVKFRRNWIRNHVLPEFLRVQPKTVEKISEFTAILRENQILNHFLFEKMKRKVLCSDGARLDLQALFSYNKTLRRFFIHRLCPRSSVRQIDQNNAILEKEIKIKKKKSFPILQLIRGN